MSDRHWKISIIFSGTEKDANALRFSVMKFVDSLNETVKGEDEYLEQYGEMGESIKLGSTSLIHGPLKGGKTWDKV